MKKETNVFEQRFPTFVRTGEGDAETVRQALEAGVRIFESARDGLYLETERENVEAFVRSALDAMGEDGLIAVMRDPEAPGDARVDLIWKPSWAVLALCMWLRTTAPRVQTAWLDEAMKPLRIAVFSARSWGHGYEAEETTGEVMLCFCRAGLAPYAEKCWTGGSFGKVLHGHMERLYAAAGRSQRDAVPPLFNYTIPASTARAALAAYEGRTVPVFVYGTLMHDQSAHDLMGGAAFVGEAALDGYAAYELGRFPGIRPRAGERVQGEMYCVEPGMLKRLDSYEGEGVLYRRQRVRVHMGDGWTATAFVYVYEGPADGEPVRGRWSGR